MSGDKKRFTIHQSSCRFYKESSMNSNYPDYDLEKRLSSLLLDVFIRVGLLLVMIVLCYRVFSPFLSLMLWALILAVSMYPIHQKLVGRIGGRQGLATIVLVFLCIVIIVIPTTMLVSSLGDSVHGLINSLRSNAMEVPAPPSRVAEWPIIGEKVYDFWSQAHNDLPALLQSMQPKIGDLAKKALSIVAGLGGKMLLFFVSFIIAGIIMAFGVSGQKAVLKIFERMVGRERGEKFAHLATVTIRAVAVGVIGIACIQALLIGLVLILAGIPLAGVLSLIVLVMGIVQLPALLVTLPTIGYIWYSGSHGTVGATVYSVLLLVAGSADNVLKPLLLGRGVDAPMPIILLGALGGMANGGILGMFIGATLLALSYQIFTRWVDENREQQGDSIAPSSS